MELFNAKLLGNLHVKVFMGDDLEKVSFYTVPNVENEIAYDSQNTVKLEQDERYFLELDDEKKSLITNEYLNLLDATTEINRITPQNYEKVRILYKVNETSLILSLITPKYILQADTIILSYGNLGPIIKEQPQGIKFCGDVTVYFAKNTSKLYFKNFNDAKKIFPWLIEFYRIADNEEVNDFLSGEFFDISDDFDNSKTGERIRKNIASVIDSRHIDFSSTETRTIYNTYATEFQLDIQITDEGKFKIEKNKDLTNILKLLQGNYFKDYIDPSRKMEATSCKQIS